MKNTRRTVWSTVLRIPRTEAIASARSVPTITSSCAPMTGSRASTNTIALDQMVLDLYHGLVGPMLIL